MSLIILDRDGVINEDSDAYIKSLEEWVPVPGSIEALAQLSAAGHTLAVATNQSGLSRGYFDLDTLEAIHGRLRELVAGQGGHIAGIFYCSHLPDEGCDCRKPATGLLRSIERELGETLVGAPFIGDSLKDLQAARAAGCTPILVRTGKGQRTEQELSSTGVPLERPTDVAIFDDLASATNALLSSA